MGSRLSAVLQVPTMIGMTNVTFDTHKFIRKLRESGMPDAQAEAVADAFAKRKVRRIWPPSRIYASSNCG